MQQDNLKMMYMISTYKYSHYISSIKKLCYWSWSRNCFGYLY